MSEANINPEGEGESYEPQSLAEARVKLGLDIPNKDEPVGVPDYLSDSEQTGLDSLIDPDKNNEPGVGATPNTMPAEAPTAPYLADSERTTNADSAVTTQKFAATSLPVLPIAEATAVEKPSVDDKPIDRTGLPEGITAKRGESNSDAIRRDIRERYNGLSPQEIAAMIQTEFFDSKRVERSRDIRGKRLAALAEGGKDYDMAAFSEALIMHDKAQASSKEYAARVKTSEMNKHYAVKEARNKIDAIVPNGDKISINSFNQADSEDRIAELTRHWESKGYLQKTDTGYGISARLYLDKGKMLTAESIMRKREEALDRMHPKPKAPKGKPELKNGPSAFEELSQQEAVDASDKPQEIQDRLAVFTQAWQETDGDSDEREMVMGQLFRQGMMNRVTIDEGLESQHTAPKGLNKLVDDWYQDAYAQYQSDIQHSDQEREEADQITNNVTERSRFWLKSRANMREGSSDVQRGDSATDKISEQDPNQPDSIEEPEVSSEPDSAGLRPHEVAAMASYGDLLRQHDELKAKLPKPGTLAARLAHASGRMGLLTPVYRQLTEIEAQLHQIELRRREQDSR